MSMTNVPLLSKCQQCKTVTHTAQLSTYLLPAHIYQAAICYIECRVSMTCVTVAVVCPVPLTLSARRLKISKAREPAAKKFNGRTQKGVSSNSQQECRTILLPHVERSMGSRSKGCVTSQVEGWVGVSIVWRTPLTIYNSRVSCPAPAGTDAPGTSVGGWPHVINARECIDGEHK